MNKNRFFLIMIFFVCSATCLYKVNAQKYSVEQENQIRAKVIAKAKSYLGATYKRGATGPKSFDCSGLVYKVFMECAEIKLARSAKAIYSEATIYKSNKAKPGDLLFFKTTGNGTISHVGIFIGKNKFIHSASDGSKTGVIVSSLKEKYWSKCFAGAGTVLQ